MSNPSFNPKRCLHGILLTRFLSHMPICHSLLFKSSLFTAVKAFLMKSQPSVSLNLHQVLLVLRIKLHVSAGTRAPALSLPIQAHPHSAQPSTFQTQRLFSVPRKSHSLSPRASAQGCVYFFRMFSQRSQHTLSLVSFYPPLHHQDLPEAASSGPLV